MFMFVYTFQLFWIYMSLVGCKRFKTSMELQLVTNLRFIDGHRLYGFKDFVNFWSSLSQHHDKIGSKIGPSQS